MKGEETNKIFSYLDDLIKYAVIFDLRLLEALSEVVNCEIKSQFRLWVNPI